MKKSYLILMADGNIEDHNMVKKAFRECGINHVFNSVYNGRQLLDHFLLKGAYSREDDVQPDLVIMDLQLDLVEGLEILKFIGENRNSFNMPIYVMSRSTQPEQAHKAKALGVKEVFEKPKTYQEYARIVQKICKENLPVNRKTR